MKTLATLLIASMLLTTQANAFIFLWGAKKAAEKTFEKMDNGKKDSTAKNFKRYFGKKEKK